MIARFAAAVRRFFDPQPDAEFMATMEASRRRAVAAARDARDSRREIEQRSESLYDRIASASVGEKEARRGEL